MSTNIDINTATEHELSSIRGINKDNARKIVEYRNQNGPFSAWDDLNRVPGIQSTILDSLKRQGCTVGGRAA